MGLPLKLWSRVIRAIEVISRVYDVGNRLLSLFQDWRVRVEGLKHVKCSGKTLVLDLGCGIGVLESYLTSIGCSVVCIDASYRMLRVVGRVYGRRYLVDCVNAVFENLPFRSNSFNYVLAFFSLRDSRSYIRALIESSRVCRGCMVYVDIGKPESRTLNLIFTLYLKHVVPIITSVVTGSVKGNPWRLLYYTYIYLPRNTLLEYVMSRLWSTVKFKRLMFGFVIVIKACKRRVS